jgi:hypothetical protein
LSVSVRTMSRPVLRSRVPFFVDIRVFDAMKLMGSKPDIDRKRHPRPQKPDGTSSELSTRARTPENNRNPLFRNAMFGKSKRFKGLRRSPQALQGPAGHREKAPRAQTDNPVLFVFSSSPFTHLVHMMIMIAKHFSPSCISPPPNWRTYSTGRSAS